MTADQVPTTIAVPQPAGGNRLPADIAKAIGEVLLQALDPPQAGRNGHDGHDYAGTDPFLAFVGPLCSKAGLIVLQDEESAELLDRGGQAWLRVTYAFTLAHTSGALAERPIRRTVLEPVQGLETGGRCQSCALRQFLGSLFQVPAGDRDDADRQPSPVDPQHDREPGEPTAKPSPRPSKAAKRPSSDPAGRPRHMRIEQGQDGLRVGRWVGAARETLDGQPEAWRRDWPGLHAAELEEVRRTRREWADKLEALAIAPDPVPQADAAQ